MKKNLLRPILYLLFFGAISNTLMAQQVVSAGKIDILSGVSDVNFADAICQCDTILVEYEVKPNANFPATSTFEYRLATNPGLAWGGATLLELTQLEKGDPPTALTLPSDTFSSGKKWASVVIPCNTPIGIYGFRIINRNSNGTITPVDGFSDTAFFQVNRIPTLALIDSIATVRNMSRIDTVYAHHHIVDNAIFQAKTLINSGNKCGFSCRRRSNKTNAAMRVFKQNGSEPRAQTQCLIG